MKKLFTLVCASSAMMLSAPANASWEGNFLLGLSAGYVESSGDATASIAYPAPINTLTDITQDHSDSGALWGLLAGYQWRCNSWLFGIEGSVDWHDVDEARGFQYNANPAGTLVPTSGSFAYEQGVVAALSVRAGYEITSYLMPYIRLGASTSDDDLVFSTTTNPITGATAVITGSERSVRFLGGVGLEMPIPAIAGLSARAEYNYHSRGKVIDARGNATSPVLADTGTFVTAGHKPHTHAGKFSLVYNFI